MSERTTNTLLGAFVMGGLVILAALAVSIAGSGFGHATQPVRMVFDGSITGLNIGAPVALRGVQIGQVTDIRVRLDDVAGLNLVMEVDAELDASRIQQDLKAISGIDKSLIDAGLRAQLNAQSLLTGLLYVQLDFHPDTEVTLRSLTDDRYEIPTIPSPFERFTQQLDELKLPEMASDLQSIMASVESLVSHPDFQALPSRSIAALDSAERTLGQLERTLQALEPQLADTLAQTTDTLAAVEAATPTVATQLGASLEGLAATLDSIEGTARQLESALAPDSPLLLSLTTTLRQIERTSRTLGALARSIDEQPEALLQGRARGEDNP